MERAQTNEPRGARFEVPGESRCEVGGREERIAQRRQGAGRPHREHREERNDGRPSDAALTAEANARRRPTPTTP